MIAEYVAGNLKDKIILCGKCDMEELYSNYKKLYGVSRNRKFRLESPMSVAAVYKDEVRIWRGNYYARSGKIKALKFHYVFSKTSYKANDERADEIYNWCKKIVDEIQQQEGCPEQLYSILRLLK